MKTKAQVLFEKLENADIKDKVGHTVFDFLGVETKIKAKSPVGYVFQDWLENWMAKNGIENTSPENSQEFPDFYLSPNDHNKDLLEVKTFDAEAGPNFDVANFDAYTRSVKTNAYRLDADYLIFSYKMSDEGEFTVCDFWIKKIWEITCPSNKFPLRTQVKQNVIYNIRPANWFSTNAQFQPFSSRKEFVKAIHETLLVYPKRAAESKNWYSEVEQNYKIHTGENL